MNSPITDWMAHEVSEYEMDLVKPPATVLDIGANVGAFSLMARRLWPDAKITAYEPVADNFEKLLANTALLSVECWDWAVRGFAGLRPIMLGGSGEADGFHNLGRSTEKSETVKCVDAASVTSAEFVKIDTEGCELEIVSRLDLSQTQAIAIEYHLGDWDAILKVLEAAGLGLVIRVATSETHGLIKCARPGALCPKEENPIPDEMILSGRRADGVNVSVPAVIVRNPCFKPQLKHLKLFIGLPVYQKVDTFFMQSLLALQAQKPCAMQVQVCQGDGIARSRNELTAQFLRSDCTHLLFIDCDLIFDADQVARLLSHNLPIVGGFYPKKQQGPLEWVVNTLPGNPSAVNDLQPVKYVGTGFMCIARTVFEQMAAAYPEIAYREDYGGRGLAHDFWSMAPYGVGSADGRLQRARKLQFNWDSAANGSDAFYKQMGEILFGPADSESRYLSEDWFFCQRWLDMGGEIFADCRVILKHIGTSIFPLRTQEEEINCPQGTSRTGIQSAETTDKAEPVAPVNRGASTEWTTAGCPE